MQAATISRLEGELKNTREECRQLRQRVQGKSRIAKDSSVTHENTTPKKKGSSGSGVSSLIEKYSPPEGCTPSMISSSHRGNGFDLARKSSDDAIN